MTLVRPAHTGRRARPADHAWSGQRHKMRGSVPLRHLPHCSGVCAAAAGSLELSQFCIARVSPLTGLLQHIQSLVRALAAVSSEWYKACKEGKGLRHQVYGLASCSKKDCNTKERAAAAHVPRHTSHVTRHTSHVTRHTSHVTRHTSQVVCGGD